jgi:hypothetical protein
LLRSKLGSAPVEVNNIMADLEIASPTLGSAPEGARRFAMTAGFCHCEKRFNHSFHFIFIKVTKQSHRWLQLPPMEIASPPSLIIQIFTYRVRGFAMTAGFCH